MMNDEQLVYQILEDILLMNSQYKRYPNDELSPECSQPSIYFYAHHKNVIYLPLVSNRLQPSKAGIPDNPGSRPPRDPSAPATTLSRVIFILQSQTRTRPELSSSFSPSHSLVQSYLHPSVPTTTSSRVIFIFQ